MQPFEEVAQNGFDNKLTMAIRRLQVCRTGELEASLASLVEQCASHRDVSWRDVAVGDLQDATLIQDIFQRMIRILRRSVSGMPPEQEVELRRAFCTIDVDGNGILDEAELRKVIVETRSTNFQNDDPEKLVSRLLDSMDKDGDCKISLDEFLAGMKELPVQKIPFERDFPAETSAALVAAIFEELHLIDADQEHLLLPHTFSSLGETPLQLNRGTLGEEAFVVFLESK